MSNSIKEMKQNAWAALSGRWFQPIWLLVMAYLINQVAGSLLAGAFDSTAFMYFLLVMVLNYFVLFAFQFGAYYFPMSVFGQQPFRFSMLFVAFSPYYYKRFVVLNFIKSIFVSLGSFLVFIPFIGKLSWSSLLNLIFGSVSVNLFQRLSKILNSFSIGSWLLFLAMAILYLLILIFANGFFQIASYLVFENARNPEAKIYRSALFMMRGHWGSLLKLQLSFIIWYIFYPVTFLWLIPYRQMSLFVFYLNLKQAFSQRMNDLSNHIQSLDGDQLQALIDQMKKEGRVVSIEKPGDDQPADPKPNQEDAPKEPTKDQTAADTKKASETADDQTSDRTSEDGHEKPKGD